ncbi:MAG: TonB-dependent receptor [Pseudomonadota bacterium]
MIMINKNGKKILQRKLVLYIKMASGLALIVSPMGVSTQVYAADAEAVSEVVVTGQRKAIESAQGIKKNSAQIVDSIVADDIGKLPDRSVTEALQRVPGVTIDHFMSLGDPEHFSAEGSGVAVRGLTEVRSELNGRDSFTANGGRNLSFEDVPAELMAGVDVYKNPSAEMIEGGLAGSVNLRTRMPFDAPGQLIAGSIGTSYGDFSKEFKPAYSGLYSNRWDTNIGEVGFLLDVASSEISTRTDGMFTRPFFPRTDAAGHLGSTVQVPRGADWRQMEFNRDRLGTYGALQWAPNDDTVISLTAFRSAYTMQWNEDAIFVSNDPYGVQPSADSIYDEKGVFQAGRLTADSGIPMGSDVRYATRESATTDYSLNAKWTPDEYWEFVADLQYTKAKTDSLDSTVATGVNVPYIDVDLRGDHPLVTSDNAFLADPNNYYMGFTMDHQDDNLADQKSFKVDAKYTFDNDLIIKSMKMGARVTARDADNIDTGYNWKAVYQTWMQGWAIPGGAMPTISDTSQLSLNTFDNFFKGETGKPAGVYAPALALALNFPNSFQQLHDSAVYDCCITYTPTDIKDPKYGNIQSEKTAAAYVTVSYGFDDVAMPIDGNLGVRIVQTGSVSSGHLIYPNQLSFGSGQSAEFTAENAYTNVLPTINARLKIQDDLFLRFAAGKSMARPAFSQMQAYEVLNVSAKDGITPVLDANGNPMPLTKDQVNFTLSSTSNPWLKPMEATSYDLSLEWYFDDRGGMAHMNLFRKEVDNYIATQKVVEQYLGYDFESSRPINGGSAEIQGFELGYKQFFDKLPAPFDGFGIEANYTFIDSSTKLRSDTLPVDTDGNKAYGKLPYTGLSKNAYNFTAMYEKGDWSARLAYSWRSEFLMSVGANGFNGTDKNILWKLPVYADASGQLDGSVAYAFTENLKLSLEVNNITNSETRTIMKQLAAGEHYTSYFVYDRRYALTLRASF